MVTDRPRRTRNCSSWSAADLRSSPATAPTKLWLAAALVLTGAASARAQAPSTGTGQAFPARPVELVVHTAPGGGGDLFARTVAEIITRGKLLPQPLVVSNKGGGGGAIAFNYVAGKRGDPYTLLAVPSTVLLTAPMRSGLDIGLDKFTPLASLGLDLNALSVRADAPYATMTDFVEAAKREPDMAQFMRDAGLAGKPSLVTK